MSGRTGLYALALSAVVMLTSCGEGPPRVLESITVNAVASLSGTTYSATGHFNTAPMTVNNLQVAWFQTGAVVDPPGPNWDYTMSTAPFKGTCYGGPAQFYVVAYAPENPNASASGSMPFSVFVTLVEQHSVKQDDGFVAGSGTLGCTTAELPTNPSGAVPGL